MKWMLLKYPCYKIYWFVYIDSTGHCDSVSEDRADKPANLEEQTEMFGI